MISAVKNVTVVDTVTYTNLIPGKTYTLKGELHLKATALDGTVMDGGILTINGRPVTAEKTFKAVSANGSEALEFTFDASALGGKKLVAFEKVYDAAGEVAVHTDIKDAEQTVEVKEARYGLRLLKTNSSNQLLAGAVFKLEGLGDLAGVSYEHLLTDGNGKVEVSGLKAGLYRVTETQAPVGYKLLPSFDITIDGEMSDDSFWVEKLVKNEAAEAGLKVLKKDGNSKAPLSGAKFRLEGQGSLSTIVREGVTDDAGELLWTDLLPGIYKLIEVKAPEGYELGTVREWVVTLNTGNKGQLLVTEYAVTNTSTTSSPTMKSSSKPSDSIPQSSLTRPSLPRTGEKTRDDGGEIAVSLLALACFLLANKRKR